MSRGVWTVIAELAAAFALFGCLPAPVDVAQPRIVCPSETEQQGQPDVGCQPAIEAALANVRIAARSPRVVAVEFRYDGLCPADLRCPFRTGRGIVILAFADGSCVSSSVFVRDGDGLGATDPEPYPPAEFELDGDAPLAVPCLTNAR